MELYHRTNPFEGLTLPMLEDRFEIAIVSLREPVTDVEDATIRIYTLLRIWNFMQLLRYGRNELLAITDI